jgi:hypothetical protein
VGINKEHCRSGVALYTPDRGQVIGVGKGLGLVVGVGHQHVIPDEASRGLRRELGDCRRNAHIPPVWHTAGIQQDTQAFPFLGRAKKKTIRKYQNLTAI